MIISQSQFLSTLVQQIEYQLSIFTILSREDIFPFENGGIETAPSIRSKAVFDYTFDMFSTEHFTGAIVTSTLENGR